MKVIKSLRAPVLVTLVLLLICGLIYPVVMTLMSQALFPSQANGSIIYVDGQAVGAKNVGQDFTDPRFMRCRPSAYQYNTYTVDEEGNKFYNDGSEYAGLSSGSANYANSNPALAERVEGDINNFLPSNGTPILNIRLVTNSIIQCFRLITGQGLLMLRHTDGLQYTPSRINRL